MFFVEVVALAVAVIGMVGAGVLGALYAERLWRRCKAGIRSRTTTVSRITPILSSAVFVEIALRQRAAILAAQKSARI